MIDKQVLSKLLTDGHYTTAKLCKICNSTGYTSQFIRSEFVNDTLYLKCKSCGLRFKVIT